ARAIRIDATPPVQRTIWTEPLQLPGYELGPEVGSGPHGTVYRARQEATGQAVAVKRLYPGWRAAREGLEPHAKLFRGTAGGSPPGIQPLLDVIATGKDSALVAQWVEGSHLGRILADRKAVRRGRTRSELHDWATLEETTFREQMQACLDGLLQAMSALH